MPTSFSFHPEIDRFDPASVARFFTSIWLDEAISQAIAANLAESIQQAHSVGEGSWSVTFHRDFIRLNVGQVETFTAYEEGCRFLICLPLNLEEANEGYELASSDEPFYASVPVSSGVCFVDVTSMPSLLPQVRQAHNTYILEAVTRKRGSPFRQSFSPAVLDYLEAKLGHPLPRPSYVPSESQTTRILPLPDEVFGAEKLTEGSRYQITINAYERNPEARQKCIERYGARCAICDMSFAEVYGPVAEGLIHVHHLRPLADVGERYEVNPVEDLRPVCPNCHAVLHRRNPPFSIEEVKAFLGKTLSLQ